MPTSSMSPLVHHLRRVAFQQDAAAMTDGQLLERFLSQREEAAFEALVRRHGPMVLGVCQRVLRNGHDSEDAFQAVFLVLVRKASSIVPRDLVGSWLHGVAFRTALKARSMTARRRAKEQQVRDMASPRTLDAGARNDLQERLDLELSRLPDKYRAPVLLCDLEGKSRRDAARQLGLAEGTLSSRLARARRLLARRLSAPKAVLSACGVGAIAAAQSVSASVPMPLLTSTVQAAMLLASGATAAAAASAQVAALTEGVLKAMFLSKLKTVTAFLLVVSALALSAGVFGTRSRADDDTPKIAARDDDPSDDDDKPKIDTKDKKDKKEKKDAKIIVEDKRSKVEETITKSFKTKAAPRLVVETFNGPIAVTTGKVGAVQVKVVKTVRAASEETAKEDLKNVDVQLTQEGDAIRIIAKTEGVQLRTQRAASVELQTPPGAILELKTSNGPVAVSGAVGDVKAKTSNGKIDVQGGKGKMQLKTSNGPISVDGGSNQFELHTSNGRITVKTGKGTVSAHTSNGGIEFSGTLADGSHTFHTSNGNISVTLPADARFRIDAETSHGKIQTDFAIAESEKKDKTRLRTTVGDNPAVSIKLHTSNGKIDIHAQK